MDRVAAEGQGIEVASPQSGEPQVRVLSAADKSLSPKVGFQEHVTAIVYLAPDLEFGAFFLRRLVLAKRLLDMNVYEAAIHRMMALYKQGHRIVCSFSGGKDSTVILHICKEAARATGRLPVETVFLDEEIMVPHSWDFVSRISKDPELDFHWIIQGTGYTNVYNRECPFYWAYDFRYEDKWVNPIHDSAYWTGDMGLKRMVNNVRFPPPLGKKLISVTGIRVAESLTRRRSISASGSYITKHPDEFGAHKARPIYDWEDGDVWKTILDYKLPFNPVYNLLVQLKIPRRKLRIASPTANLGQLEALMALGRACPQWFSRLCERLPGVRQAALYGESSCRPIRRTGETYQDCVRRYLRDPLTPAWIVSQGEEAIRIATNHHRRHAGEGSPFPDSTPCVGCGQLAMWKRIYTNLFIPWSMGDHVTIGPRARDFYPEFYHPDIVDLKADPWYDRGEQLFYKFDENGESTGELQDYLNG